MESGSVAAGAIDFIVCVDGLLWIVFNEFEDCEVFFATELAAHGFEGLGAG